jgi:tripartite-type tricarboxylate transporter receptor subunit TctC
MKLSRRRRFLHLTIVGVTVGISAVFALFAKPSWSQVPRSIKFIVPFPPGGPGSVLARLMADHIQSTRNVSVIVENRPGGSGAIGTEAVARAVADGSTLLIHNPSIILNPHLRKTNYDFFKSFEPLCRITDVPLFIAVNNASPYRTLRDLIEDARKNPGKLSAAALAATQSHLSLTLLKQKANVDITFVPFPGTAPMITALLGGHVTAMVDNYGGMAEQANAGKLRPFATLSRARIAALTAIMHDGRVFPDC